MFRIRDPQESLWQSQFLVTPKKAKRLERSWAEVFRNEALPLIDEERFAPMNGRVEFRDAIYTVRHGELPMAIRDETGLSLVEPANRMVEAYCAHKLR